MAEKDILRSGLITIAGKNNLKYLGISITKKVQDLYSKNYKRFEK